jgi:hypothetical protein
VSAAPIVSARAKVVSDVRAVSAEADGSVSGFELDVSGVLDAVSLAVSLAGLSETGGDSLAVGGA